MWELWNEDTTIDRSKKRGVNMGKICVKCGNELSDNAKFCTKCGMQCENSIKTVGVVKGSKKNKKKVILVGVSIVAVVLVIVGIATGFFFGFQKGV